MALSPKQVADLIVIEGGKALAEGRGRFSIEWGKFSVDLNRYIREKVKEEGPVAGKFKRVFLYWTLWSEAIECAHKKKRGRRINNQHFESVVQQLEEMKGEFNETA